MKVLGRIFGWTILLVLWALIFVQSCATVDIRPESVLQELEPDRGQALLDSMYLAHGGPLWENISTYEVDFEDDFLGTIGKMSHPYKSPNARMRLQYIPQSFDGRAIFTDPKMEGTIWGIQSWKTYIQKPGKEITFKNDKDVYFWIPTYQYFIELPIRIQQADVVSYAGQTTLNGQTYETVFVSWKAAEPQRNIDQYVLYLDPNTYRLAKVKYTVREMYNFLVGAAWYTEYKNYNGIFLPSKMPVESNIVKDEFLHEMRITDFRPNVVEFSTLQPDNSLKSAGGSKPEDFQ